MLQTNDNAVKGEDAKAASRFSIMPSAVIGIGGYPKAVFPTLDRLINEHYGFRPAPIGLSIFDFDEAKSECSTNGRKYSIDPYLVTLPKKVLKDVAKKLRSRTEMAWLKQFEAYVDLKYVKYAEAPGLNLFVQSGNLAWRLVWEPHVLPALKTMLKGLHPLPQDLNALERAGFKVSKRSTIWVIAGGGSTTGPTGLIPIVAELKRNKPPETNLFIIIFTPNAYRDKTDAHRARGRAIYMATMERLLGLYNGDVFDQPYSPGGYRIKLEEDPADQIFLVDGSLSGGRTELKSTEIGEIVANFLYRFITSPSVGEKALGIIGNLNSGLKPVEEVNHEN